MSEFTVEAIYLEEIWDVFNQANENLSIMLSLIDEEKIIEKLKEYRIKANEVEPKTSGLNIPVVRN